MIKRDKDLEDISIKTIKDSYITALVIIVCCGIGLIILGIVLMSYNQYGQGIATIVGGILGLCLFWTIIKPLFGVAYDIKIMRYHSDGYQIDDLIKSQLKEELIKEILNEKKKK